MMHAKYMKAVGAALREVRMKRGFTISDLRCETHITHRTIVDIERGEAYPKLNTVFTICKVLEISPVMLFTMADNRL